MFKTIPYVSEKVWGYENWIVSTHKVGQSKRAEDNENISNILGNDYPLLIKLIQANETLSVQVHPEDDYAAKVENTYGKTECWYILDAKPNATLGCGLNKDYTREELATAIQNNTLDNCLKYVPVEKGDFVFIPAGTVHAIQGGLRILEIQQPSDVTYRLYDWGRPREIHIEKGLDVTKAYAPEPEKPFSKDFSCNYFTLIQQDVSEKETKITLAQTNPGQCIWYMYKCDDSYMYVLSIGKGNGEHGKLYKMSITSSSASANGTIAMTTTPNPDDILKIVVNGSTQTLYCNDTELCTLTDCNTVGIANQQAGNNAYIASKWAILE